MNLIAVPYVIAVILWAPLGLTSLGRMMFGQPGCGMGGGRFAGACFMEAGVSDYCIVYIPLMIIIVVFGYRLRGNREGKQ